MTTIYNNAMAIIPSNTDDFVGALSDGIYVGAAGEVVAVFQNGNTGTFTAAAGQILPLKVKRINSTGTTAQLLMALFKV